MKYGYIRTDTKTNEDLSLTIQKNMLNKYQVDALYIDEGYSGMSLLDRPQLLKMMNEIKPEDTIIIKDMARISRNNEHLYKFLKELEMKKIRLIVLSQNIDTKRDGYEIITKGQKVLDELKFWLSEAIEYREVFTGTIKERTETKTLKEVKEKIKEIEEMDLK